MDLIKLSNWKYQTTTHKEKREREIVMEESEAAVLLDHHVDEDKSLPGFRFHPTDEELVGFYLRRKVEKKRLSIDIIRHIDIYKYDPWDLSKLNTIGIGDKEWYFFCLRGRKYRNSVRPNRVTESGFWKATGIDKKIYFPAGTNNCIGLKKSLVYYLGSAGKGNKTDWMMHEFRLPPKSSSDEAKDSIYSDEAHEAENWTICRILKRNPSPKKSITPPWMESRRRYSPTQTDDGSPSSSCLIDTRDQFTTSETIHLKQDLGHLQVNPSCHVDQINQCSEEQGSINNGVCVVDQQIQDFSQQQLGDFDCNRYLYSTGFDALPENCEIARTKYECDDSIWDEIGRILEC